MNPHPLTLTIANWPRWVGEAFDRGRLNYRSLEVRVCEVQKDSLDVNIVLGTRGKHLQLKQGRQVLRLIPADQDLGLNIVTGLMSHGPVRLRQSELTDAPHTRHRHIGSQSVVTRGQSLWSAGHQHPPHPSLCQHMLNTWTHHLLKGFLILIFTKVFAMWIISYSPFVQYMFYDLVDRCGFISISIKVCA